MHDKGCQPLPGEQALGSTTSESVSNVVQVYGTVTRFGGVGSGDLCIPKETGSYTRKFW